MSIYILFFELYSELRKLVEAKLLVNSDIKAQFEIDYLAKLISSRIFQSKKKGILGKNPAAGTACPNIEMLLPSSGAGETSMYLGSTK